MARKKQEYNNESITALTGADRVRKRPAVIFGSDGLDGCEHSFFEILSNSIDEAREGYGDRILVTRYLDQSLEVQDFARGIPVDYNPREQRYNWELVFCELYAGGKYKNNGAAITSFRWGSTDWAPVPRSMRRNISTWKCSATASISPSILKRGKTSAGCTRNRRKTKRPVPASAGNRTWRSLPTSTFRSNFSAKLKAPAVVNRGLVFVFRNEVPKASLKPKNSAIPKGSPTTSRKSPANRR